MSSDSTPSDGIAPGDPAASATPRSRGKALLVRIATERPLLLIVLIVVADRR